MVCKKNSNSSWSHPETKKSHAKTSWSLSFQRSGLEHELGDTRKGIKERNYPLKCRSWKTSWSSTLLKTKWRRDWKWRKVETPSALASSLHGCKEQIDESEEWISLEMRVSLSTNWTLSLSNWKIDNFKVLNFKWYLWNRFLYAETFWRCIIAMKWEWKVLSSFVSTFSNDASL